MQEGREKSKSRVTFTDSLERESGKPRNYCFSCNAVIIAIPKPGQSLFSYYVVSLADFGNNSSKNSSTAVAPDH